MKMKSKGTVQASSTKSKSTLSPQRINEIGLAVALVLLIVVLSLRSPFFASFDNMWAILGDAALVGIVAWPATLIIIAGDIDLSVGPAVAFWSVILADLMAKFHFNLWISIVLTLFGGWTVGCFAGWLRGRFGVPSFIVTLGLWSSFRGAAQFMTNSLPVAINPNGLMDFLSGKIGPIPTPAVLMFALFLVFAFIARRTTFGRTVYAVGGNPRAAILAGINVVKIRVLIFGLSGMLSAFLALVIAARLSSGTSSAGQGLEFSVIAAVVVGGTSLSGGRGTLLGTLLGTVFIAVIGNGLVILGVNSYFQDVLRGFLIVGAVLINTIVSRRGSKDSKFA